MPCTTAHHLSNGILHCHKWYFTLCHKTLSSALRAPASRNPLPHPPARAPCGAPRCAALAAVLFGTRPTRGRAPGFSDAPGEPRPAPRARTVRPGGVSTASLPSYAGRSGAEAAALPPLAPPEGGGRHAEPDKMVATRRMAARRSEQGARAGGGGGACGPESAGAVEVRGAGRGGAAAGRHLRCEAAAAAALRQPSSHAHAASPWGPRCAQRAGGGARRLPGAAWWRPRSPDRRAASGGGAGAAVCPPARRASPPLRQRLPAAARPARRSPAGPAPAFPCRRLSPL